MKLITVHDGLKNTEERSSFFDLFFFSELWGADRSSALGQRFSREKWMLNLFW